MNRRIFFVLSIIAVIFVGFVYFSSHRKQPTPEFSLEQPAVVIGTGVDDRYVDIMVNLQEQIVLGLRESANEFPVSHAREELKEVLRRIDSKEIVMAFDFSSGDDVPDVYGRASRMTEPDNRPVITLFPLRLIAGTEDLRKEGYDNQTGNELLKDACVAIVLHEYFHVQHHVITGEDEVTHARQESEAWWYMTSEVIMPAMRAGHFQHYVLPEFLVVMIAYKNANGDVNSIQWQQFMAALKTGEVYLQLPQ